MDMMCVLFLILPFAYGSVIGYINSQILGKDFLSALQLLGGATFILVLLFATPYIPWATPTSETYQNMITFLKTVVISLIVYVSGDVIGQFGLDIVYKFSI